MAADVCAIRAWRCARPRLSSLVLLLAGMATNAQGVDLLNVSYDVSRAVYEDINPAFAAAWQHDSGSAIHIDQSHAGSSKQARAVIDGLPADVVTMNSPMDIDAIAKAGLLPPDWAAQFPDASSPSWSIIVFVVRKGNPKSLQDWPDLIKPRIQVVLPNPKTSGNGRYSYLAAWQFAREQAHGKSDEADASIHFERKLLANVPILDVGGRDATTTFAQRGIGDALLTFESEAKLILATFGADQFEIVYPSLTVRADNPVAVVMENTDKKGSTAVARAYLQFHYTKAAQEIFAKRGLRVVDADIAKRHAAEFPSIRTFSVADAFGGWGQAQAAHFSTGGSFDKIMAEAKR